MRGLVLVLMVVVVEGVTVALFPGCAAWEPFAPSNYIIITLELNVNGLVRHVRDCGGLCGATFRRDLSGA